METTTLENLGFTNLVYYNTYNEALAAFMNGEIRFIASDFFHLTSALPSGYYVPNVHVVTRYRTVYYYIAFSKDVSNDVVSNVQKEIETLIENQSTTSIVKKYLPLMPAAYIAGKIQLFTELSPPSSYTTGTGSTSIVQGSSIDILNEIQARTGYINLINVSIWNDAYAIAQYLPNSAVFATARTPERENMFQWVGPIRSNRTYFYTRSASGLTIATLEQAKALQSIATPNGWFTHDFLKNNNFKNIIATSLTTQDAFNQLLKGEVQALLLPDVDVKWLAGTNGVQMSDLTQHMKALDINSYIAFSLSTPASTVQKWQNHLDAMKTDGTFKTIWNKWYGGIPMP
jgi:polar amino acid transport system substrate-binding protein